MKLVIDRELPRATEIIAVHVRGHWIDGHEDFSEQECFPDSKSGHESALAMVQMYTRMQDHKETESELQDWLDENKITPDVSIPVNSHDPEALPLPIVYSVQVLLYDKDGRTFKMKLGH
jgi:hypothetical protein